MSIAIAIADRFLARDEDDDDDAALGRRMSDYAECPTTTSRIRHTQTAMCAMCARRGKRSLAKDGCGFLVGDICTGHGRVRYGYTVWY